MNQFVTEQLIYVLRLVAAALCGGLIGCERQSKKKTAGTRTHVIIAVASAMMMIISKYGFGDVLNEYVKLDPSRVAAGVVTAIGFIGSGIFIFRNNCVNESLPRPEYGRLWAWVCPWERECIFWGLYPQPS